MTGPPVELAEKKSIWLIRLSQSLRYRSTVYLSFPQS